MQSEREAVRALIRDRLASNGHSYGRDSLPSAARWARESVATLRRWEHAEDAGLVRFRTLPDEGPYDAGDTYDVDMHKDTVPGGERAIVAQRKAEESRLERDGLWGIACDYRVSPSMPWTPGDSVWGFVGDDWQDSGYDVDVRAETLASLVDALKSRCPVCRKAS